MGKVIPFRRPEPPPEPQHSDMLELAQVLGGMSTSLEDHPRAQALVLHYAEFLNVVAKEGSIPQVILTTFLGRLVGAIDMELVK